MLSEMQTAVSDLKCVGCGKYPAELAEYVDAGAAEELSADDYVRENEGTYNQVNGHFYCTECYIADGMPLGVAP